MRNPEKITPRQAGEQSAQNYTKHAIAVAALVNAQEIIDRSTLEAKDSELDDMRRASSLWHVEWWSGQILPEGIKHLKDVNLNSTRDYQKNQESYRQAAIAEALLDGVEIKSR